MADDTVYGGTSDQDLLALHVGGDPDAFGELVRRHRDRLWAVALRTLGDREEAADAVQDALVSAYRAAHTSASSACRNEDALSGRGVSWCATCDGFFFKDQDIAVIGGGDTAMEEATFLSRFAKSVTIVHRRDTLRASKAMQERAFADPKIKFVWDSEVAEIQGDPKLSGLKLRNLKTGELSDLAVTGLFIAIGHDPRTELFKGQLDLDGEGYLKVEAPSTRTNLTGVFGAGDVVDHTYRQAITAAGTGCSAALDAERFLAALADEEKAEPEKTAV